MKSILLMLLGMLSLSALAQVEVKDVSVLLDARGDALPATDVTRLQDRVRIGFVIDAAGLVEIVGLATTGTSFSNDWTTLATKNGQPDVPAMAFRNIYLRKVMGPITVEGGALSPEPTVGSAGLAPSGWLDGIRVKANTKIGDIKVVAGSLGDFKTPNAFAREYKANFIEIELDRQILSNLASQTALEIYNNEPYLRQGFKLDLKILGDKVFKLFADLLYDFERKAFSYEVGTEFDVLKNIVNKYDNRLNLKLYYSNINENIPDRSQTITAFYTYGPRGTIQLGGKLDKQGNVNWFTRASIGEQNRFDVGINMKIPYKK